jgi:hypothetical protein
LFHDRHPSPPGRSTGREDQVAVENPAAVHAREPDPVGSVPKVAPPGSTPRDRRRGPGRCDHSEPAGVPRKSTGAGSAVEFGRVRIRFGGGMSDQLYKVHGGRMRALERVTLAQAGLTERGDLQEWLIDNPEVLGADSMIVTAEFDRWQTRAGARALDRLDLLALRRDGTVQVAELKRGAAPDTVEMQALKYAAMVSGFSAAELADQHARFRTNRGEPLTEDDALEVLLRYAPDLQDEGPRIPEVVLVVESFPPVVLTTVVFLHEQLELPMRLVTIGAYRFADGELVVRATQLYPIDEVDTLKPRREERRQFQNARRGVRVVDPAAQVRRAASRDGVALRPSADATGNAGGGRSLARRRPVARPSRVAPRARRGAATHMANRRPAILAHRTCEAHRAPDET